MIGKVLGLVLTLLVVQNGECVDPPVVKGSFIAWGEIVQPSADMEDLIVIQTSFEECYDADKQNAAFLLYLSGQNMTFVKNQKTNQTLLYTVKDGTEVSCTEIGEKEWTASDIDIGLLSFEDDDGTVKFSLAQFFNLPNKYLMDNLQGIATTYRGIPSKSWTYEFRARKKDDEEFDHSLTITSYWSDDKWNTTAGQKVIPLGFNVSKIRWSEPPLVEDYVLSVFGFVPDAYDHKYFEPYQGIICATRKSTLKFPDVKNIRAISLHSEMALTNDQELRYIDTWFDPVNQLVRVDVERMTNEDPRERKNKHYQSEISIGKMGVVFRWGYFKGESECKVIPFAEYENDLQNFFDVKQSFRRWQMGRLFGLNETAYVYLGKATKNDVPCHLFQGVRTDWPDKDSNVTTLWEWCFNVNMSNTNDIVMFDDDEFGLISADVTILSHPNSGYKNYKMSHHFYEVKVQDPKILDATSFDIGRCFRDTEKRLLQFHLDVDIGKDNRHLYENATSDVNFLQRWKAAIYQHTELSQFSLRVSNVRATINNHKLYIKFSILPVHDKLPKDAKGREIAAFTAEMNLREQINSGNVSITYALQKKAIVMRAVRHSVQFQIDPKFEPQTLPTLPPTTPTVPTVFSLKTDPPRERTGSTPDGTGSTKTGRTDAVTSSTDETVGELTTPITDPGKIIVDKTTGHGSGSVAGVAIAMLLVGVTIGSAGTFYKFNGLPACMKS